jgi:hypothetical protein
VAMWSHLTLMTVRGSRRVEVTISRSAVTRPTVGPASRVRHRPLVALWPWVLLAACRGVRPVLHGGRLGGVRVADIQPGAHCAYRSGGSDLPSRVEVTGAPTAGSVDIFIHVARGPRSRGDRRLRPGSIIRVPTLHLIATWADWLASADAAHDRALPTGSVELLPDGMFRVRPERVPDPDRPLPDSYTNLGPLSRRLTGASDLPDHAAAQLSARPDALVRWCVGLPVAVVRDVVAAASRRGLPAQPGTVGAVFSRAGTLLAALLTRHAELIDCFPTVTGADVAFSAAHTPSARSAPWEPELPDGVLVTWSRVVTAAPPGWLRIGLRAQDGTFHRPGCTLTAPTYRTGPLWRALLAGPRPCRGCGGAGLAPHSSLLAFAAASDAWQARGARGIGERWQLDALAAAFEFAASEQIRTGQPDTHDPVGQLIGRAAGPAVENGCARDLLDASAAWRRLPDADKDTVIAGVDHTLEQAAELLGAEAQHSVGDDRAAAARRLRHRLHTLAAHAALDDTALAALLFRH